MMSDNYCLGCGEASLKDRSEQAGVGDGRASECFALLSEDHVT